MGYQGHRQERAVLGSCMLTDLGNVDISKCVRYYIRRGED